MAGSGCNAYQIRKIYAIGGALGMVKRNEEDDLLHEDKAEKERLLDLLGR